MIKKTISLIIIAGGFFALINVAQANQLGSSVNFYVDTDYDSHGREQVSATLKEVGDYIYFYIEDDYWNSLDSDSQRNLRLVLGDLANEFDTVIYPRERAVFGSEWKPGVDNDDRITVLITQLVSNVGGYINNHNEYLRSQIPTSNQREMIYLNSLSIFESNNKAFLAHEFQHLITFYQKTVLHGIEEEVWLNEARSEYAPTVCGYNDNYNNSYLADRVDVFLDSPSDSLTEWKNKLADYGVINVFFHYLINHFGESFLTKMALNDKVGIESINQALADSGYSEKFSDIFTDWLVASYLNNCQITPENKYCYLDDNLNYAHLHTDYTASYSGFPDLIISRSSIVKDWSAHWYRFRQTESSTNRNTFKLVFEGLGNRADFQVPYIIINSENEPTIGSINLINQQGTIYVPEFGVSNEALIIAPFNKYKEKGFTNDEPSASFSFTASSIDKAIVAINNLYPVSGSLDGGYEIKIQGAGFSQVNKIIFAGEEIDEFEIINDENIIFTAPKHSAGLVNITVVGEENEDTLANAFTYASSQSEYRDGSLLRAKDDYKVYVIKGNYKRWIQTAEIFNYYGHLKWEDIIDVEPEILEKYQDSWLVRADNDFKVYQLDASGNRHWLNMTAEEFINSGYRWEMVYLINSWERNYYQVGSEIKSA